MTGSVLWRNFLQLLFPPRCLFCGQLLPIGERLCNPCLETVQPQAHWRQLPLPKGGSLPCLSLYDYGAVQAGVLGMKFHDQKENGAAFGALLGESAEVLEYLPPHAALVPVPISAQRRRERGYNQTELMVQRLSAMTGLPWAVCLEKYRHTDAQSTLSREERLENVQDVYRKIGRVRGRTLVLVDDIVTTGATLTACGQTLYDAGAKEVLALTLAFASGL